MGSTACSNVLPKAMCVGAQYSSERPSWWLCCWWDLAWRGAFLPTGCHRASFLMKIRAMRSSICSYRTELLWNAQERSEEHTSELQSRGHLVCRLLLEKKKAMVCTSAIRKATSVIDFVATPDSATRE